jgi:hypothetical protein
MPNGMSYEEWAWYEDWCDADPERGLDDGGVQKRAFQAGFQAGRAAATARPTEDSLALDALRTLPPGRRES